MLRQMAVSIQHDLYDKIMISSSQKNIVKFVKNECKFYPVASAQHDTVIFIFFICIYIYSQFSYNINKLFLFFLFSRYK